MKVLIYGNIGEKVDGDAISQQLRDSAQTTNDIDVHINSYGGNVQQGVSIFSTIVSLNNEGKNINTYIDGFAASIASIIAIAGKKIFMNDFARIMVHEAFVDGGKNLSENDKKALNEINDMIAQILSRRGINKNTIASKMRNETWIRSKDAKEMGIVDEVMETRATLKQRAEIIMESQEMQPSRRLSFINNLLGEDAVTTVINTKSKIYDMDKLKMKLDLNSEEKIIAKFDELNDKVKTLETEKSELEQAKEALENEKTERTNNEIIALIDKAIEDDKLTKEKRDDLIKQGKESPETIKTFVNSLPEQAKGSLSEQFKAQNPGAGGEKTEDLAKEYEDMAKNNPQALQKIEATNPERFKALYEAWNEA